MKKKLTLAERLISSVAAVLLNSDEPDLVQLNLPILPPPRVPRRIRPKTRKRPAETKRAARSAPVQNLLNLEFIEERYAIPSVHPIPNQLHAGLSRIGKWLDDVGRHLVDVVPNYSTTTSFRIRRDRITLLKIDSGIRDKRVLDLLDLATREKFAKVANLTLVSGDREFCDLMINLFRITKWLVLFMGQSDLAEASTRQHR